MEKLTPTQTRRKTDALLSNTERRISSVYKENPALVRIYKEIQKYMAGVQGRTEAAYNAWKSAEDADTAAELKEAYMAAVKAETLNSKEYQGLIRKFCEALTQANKEAIAISNKTMRTVYAMNYNEVAGDCKDAGIKVVQDGEN